MTNPTLQTLLNEKLSSSAETIVPVLEKVPTEVLSMQGALTTVDISNLIIPSQVSVGAPILFSQLTKPVGVATDLAGNIFVTAEDFFGPTLFKFAPSGALLGQVQLAPLLSPVDVFGNTRLVLEPTTGFLLSLAPGGAIQLIDPGTGSIQPLLSLQDIPARTDRVFDVAQGTFVNMTGTILPQLASYGDIALFNGDGFTDIYVSGISVGFPFIERLRFADGQGLVSAEVIVSSIATAAPNQGQPPGVAVNSQGVVLTTLPIPAQGGLGNFNVPVVLPVDLDLNNLTGSFSPTPLSSLDVASTGMTTDAAGNFYVATGAVGSTAGGVNGSGSVLIFAPNLELVDVLTIPTNVSTGALPGAGDVALNADGSALYVTYDNTISITNPLVNPSGGLLVYPVTNSNLAVAAVAQAPQLETEDDLTGAAPTVGVSDTAPSNFSDTLSMTNLYAAPATDELLNWETESVPPVSMPMTTVTPAIFSGEINSNTFEPDVFPRLTDGTALITEV